jgi:hypothetical protein
MAPIRSARCAIKRNEPRYGYGLLSPQGPRLARRCNVGLRGSLVSWPLWPLSGLVPRSHQLPKAQGSEGENLIMARYSMEESIEQQQQESKLIDDIVSDITTKVDQLHRFTDVGGFICFS